MRRNVCSFRMPLRFLRGHYGRRTLTVLALASGVSAMCANDLLSRAVLQAFGDVIDTTAGRTALQVSSAGGFFPQDTVAAVAQVPGVAQAAGVVSATAFMTDESGELLTVHGLNLADATAARFYGVGGSPQRTLHDLRVLFPGSVLLTRSFATRRGLAVGDRLDLDTPSGRQTFTVRGLIDPQGLARLYQGNLIVMHLPAAEAAFTRSGYINRVDVLVQPGHEPADVANAIRAALPAGLRVEAPGYRKEYLARALWSMRVMLSGSALSILVTAFLIAFNSLATLFEARAWQLGVLRAVGVRPRVVWRELVKEGLLLGVFGVGLGIPAGIANAHFFLPMIATAAALNSKLLTPEAALVIHGSSLALAAGTGLAAAFLAAALPAWRAAQRGVAETVRGRGTEQPGIGAGSRWLILGVVAAAAAFAIAAQVIMHSAPWGIAATGLIALTTTLAARPLIQLLGPPLLGVLTRLAGPPARLAAANLTRNPRRTALMVATIGVGLGSVLWLRIVAQSFERSVIDILTEAIRADLIVSSAHFESSLLEAPVDDRLVSQLEDIPGVAAAAAVRVTEWQHAGGPITVNAYDPAYFTDPTFGRWPLLGEQSPDAWHAVARGAAVVISSNFAHNLRVRVGDTVTLATPSGPLPLRVAGITTQFVSPRGTLFMSRDLYARSWNDSQVTRVYVRAADRADIAALRSAIAHTLGRMYALRILSSRALVEYFATQVRRAFAGVYILAASILFVVLIGMAETLAAGVIARTREIGAIRVVGVRRRHLRSMVLVEGLALGTVGLVLAAASGFVQGTLWVKATFPCLFGWVFDWHVPYFDAGLVAVLTLAVCLAAALLPAHRAARLDPATALRDE
jgi:putative ABC transport system permease protein